ncbi:coiled-coil domain-containing protein 55-domain containing protein [Delphinella strobiligena]|nr:coiled-coil domain-containing protein 55-domain containing protein [Delphinella strobiligena]
MRDVKAVASKAEELDPTIYDYDAFHTAHSSVQQQRKAADRQDAIERKPKYIGNLLDAAARRKQDQLVAREKLLQKERENEGDEFADKEKFVTGAYKAQQAETQRLEEEEKRKAEQEEERRRRTGGGLQGFYRNLMGEEDKRHQEAIEAAAKLERGEVPASAVVDEDKTKTDADIASEMRAKGVNVHINDEGQVSDKRQLLSAGLNVAPAIGKGGSGAADHLKSSNNKNRENAFQTGRYDRNDQKSMRERQTRMLEHQLEESAKRKREEEEEERKALEEKSKSRKTEADVSSARERYLARKKAQEEAKKNKGAAA